MGKELYGLMDELNKFAEVAKKEVEKIVKKGDLTPQEVESIYKLTCITEKLMCMSDEGEGDESYGMSGRYYDDGYSAARGRSPVTGRYISRGMGSNGYSGHSIEDRMIAALEDQMDAAKNEYERKMIQEEIQRIRMGTMNQR